MRIELEECKTEFIAAQTADSASDAWQRDAITASHGAKAARVAGEQFWFLSPLFLGAGDLRSNLTSEETLYLRVGDTELAGSC